MSRVTVTAVIENLQDVWCARRGLRSVDDVRRVTVQEALVDTGAVALSLPIHLIHELGLAPVAVRDTVTTAGRQKTRQYEPVQVSIDGRCCTVDVLEIPDQVPVLIGRSPLEFLDLVVDPSTGKLIGNPEHGGKQIIEHL